MKSKADMAEQVADLVLSGKVTAPHVTVPVATSTSCATDGTPILMSAGTQLNHGHVHTVRERHESISSFPSYSPPRHAQDATLAASQLQDTHMLHPFAFEQKLHAGAVPVQSHQYGDQNVYLSLLQKRKMLLLEQYRELERRVGTPGTTNLYHQYQQQPQQNHQLVDMQFACDQILQRQQQLPGDHQLLQFQQYQELLSHQRPAASSYTAGTHRNFAQLVVWTVVHTVFFRMLTRMTPTAAQYLGAERPMYDGQAADRPQVKLQERVTASQASGQPSTSDSHPVLLAPPPKQQQSESDDRQMKKQISQDSLSVLAFVSGADRDIANNHVERQAAVHNSTAM